MKNKKRFTFIQNFFQNVSSNVIIYFENVHLHVIISHVALLQI